MPAIEVKDLSFGFLADTLVLEDIDWTVEEGDFVAIVGPNGGGKTTLLKLLLGMLTPQKGAVQIFGKPPTQAVEMLGYVPQSLHYDRQFPITAFEVILMGRLSKLSWLGKFSKEDIQLAKEALEQVGLTDFASAPFGSLSGGQRQRILIARALVSKPKLLLLDEPTASVDVQAENEIYHLLRQLKGSMTIVMVTHDLQTAINNVEHVVCVQRTLRSLTKDEVCQHYAIGLYHPPLTNLPKSSHVVS